MRKVIPFMSLMKEEYFIFDIHLPKPEIFCKVFEDNQLRIAFVESNKISPGTKHIAIRYHNFQRFVRKKIFYIYTQEQIVGILDKALNKELFVY